MLQRFVVENFRSINERLEMNFEANAGIKDDAADLISFTNTHVPVLNAVAVYGHNSSGKTNLLMALLRMRNMVLSSVKLNDNDSLPYEPFLLTESEENRPTTFLIVFSKDSNTYNYEFSYTSSAIVSESLSVKMPGKSLKQIFTRSDSNFDFSDPSQKQQLNLTDEMLNKNRLLLSLTGQLGGLRSNEVIRWFSEDLSLISGIDDEMYSEYTKHLIHENKDMKEKILDFLKKMDLGFDDLITQKIDFSKVYFNPGTPREIIEEIKNRDLIEMKSIHNVYDQKGNFVRTITFDFEDAESAGTNKLFRMAGPIVKAIENGLTICVDEIDAKIHPSLCQKLIYYFNKKETNPLGAQLLFTIHNTSIMSNKWLRRDQIWLTYKDEHSSTRVKSLMEVKQRDTLITPRSDSNYEKQYLADNYIVNTIAQECLKQYDSRQ